MKKPEPRDVTLAKVTWLVGGRLETETLIPDFDFSCDDLPSTSEWDADHAPLRVTERHVPYRGPASVSARKVPKPTAGAEMCKEENKQMDVQPALPQNQVSDIPSWLKE